jgi:hypothetical protein
MSEDQDWRLKAELDMAGDVGGASGQGGAGGMGGALEHLLGRLRDPLRGGPDVVHEVQAAIPHDVVLTHDGSLLFAYAADAPTLTATRRALEAVLSREQIKASIFISHWDDTLDAWRQTDPPPSAADERKEDAAVRNAEAIETRTLVASSGKMIRAELEQSMLTWADQLAIHCTIIEHPHLLTTQIGFTVTGPRRKLDEFSQGLAAEEAATIRTERAVMMSPL